MVLYCHCGVVVTNNSYTIVCIICESYISESVTSVIPLLVQANEQ